MPYWLRNGFDDIQTDKPYSEHLARFYRLSFLKS